MNRKVAQALLGAAMLAALAGCAYQDPLALPDLGTPARSSQQQYPGYSPNYGSGYNYGYGYGYGSGYRPGYDPYYSPYYGGGDPRYYAPGVVYVPYPRYVPVPCADANGDGRCDQRPPKNRGHREDAGNGGDRPDVQHNGVERPPPRPAQVRPPEPPRRAAPPPDRGPRVSPGRPAATNDDRSPSRPTPEP
ncbi:MAG: hypothetical protein ACRC6L_04825 [Steroidobacteraceae bacterium]